MSVDYIMVKKMVSEDPSGLLQKKIYQHKTKYNKRQMIMSYFSINIGVHRLAFH